MAVDASKPFPFAINHVHLFSSGRNVREANLHACVQKSLSAYDEPKSSRFDIYQWKFVKCMTQSYPPQTSDGCSYAWLRPQMCETFRGSSIETMDLGMTFKIWWIPQRHHLKVKSSASSADRKIAREENWADRKTVRQENLADPEIVRDSSFSWRLRGTDKSVLHWWRLGGHRVWRGCEWRSRSLERLWGWGRR